MRRAPNTSQHGRMGRLGRAAVGDEGRMGRSGELRGQGNKYLGLQGVKRDWDTSQTNLGPPYSVEMAPHNETTAGEPWWLL